MNNESPCKALIVVTATAFVCSILVTVAAVTLQPIQQAYANLDRIRVILMVSGIVDDAEAMTEFQLAAAFQDLDAQLVDLDRGVFDTTFNPLTFDAREAGADPQLSVEIPAAQNVAQLGRRARFATVYLLEDDRGLQRIILPVHGQGMWSTLYGFIVLESDLNTIAAMTIYEQGETPGIGDVITRPDWLATWRGRKLFDEQNNLRFAITRGPAIPDSPDAVYEVDGFAGATITANGVANMIRYWFGPHGYARFLANLAEGSV